MLKAANMLKNYHLARAIGYAGWDGVITKLEYKAAEKGVHLVKLDQWLATSKNCYCCGHKMPEMPLHKRIWQCPECGVEHDCDDQHRTQGHTGITSGGTHRFSPGGQHKGLRI